MIFVNIFGYFSEKRQSKTNAQLKIFENVENTLLIDTNNVKMCNSGEYSLRFKSEG